MILRQFPKHSLRQLLPQDFFELLQQSMSGFAPNDMLTHLIDRVEGRK